MVSSSGGRSQLPTARRKEHAPITSGLSPLQAFQSSPYKLWQHGLKVLIYLVFLHNPSKLEITTQLVRSGKQSSEIPRTKT